MGWTITWEEFKLYATDFTTVSDEIGDGWSWHGNEHLPGGAYISKKVTKQIPEGLLLHNPDEKESIEDSSFSTEDFSTDHVENSRECTWDYHILYSPSYSTPVLYFNTFTSDGRLLPLEILWKGFIGGTIGALQQQRWEALSQQEHPILRRPFFHLHPCKTAEFLHIHQGISANPVVTWLSSVGPAIGLTLANQYSHLVKQQIELPNKKN